MSIEKREEEVNQHPATTADQLSSFFIPSPSFLASVVHFCILISGL
jgi:hypothetical protein